MISVVYMLVSTGRTFFVEVDGKTLVGKLKRKTSQPIPDEELEALFKYLTRTVNATHTGCLEPKEQVKHLLAPILVMLCRLIDGAKLEINQTEYRNGEVYGHFDFVLCRGKAKIGVVEVPWNAFVPATAQALVGCEAIAATEDLHVVYAVVTDFFSWELFQSGEDGISNNSTSLRMRWGTLDRAALRIFCEKIHGVLLDLDEENEKDRQLVLKEREPRLSDVGLQQSPSLPTPSLHSSKQDRVGLVSSAGDSPKDVASVD